MWLEVLFVGNDLRNSSSSSSLILNRTRLVDWDRPHCWWSGTAHMLNCRQIVVAQMCSPGNIQMCSPETIQIWSPDTRQICSPETAQKWSPRATQKLSKKNAGTNRVLQDDIVSHCWEIQDPTRTRIAIVGYNSSPLGKISIFETTWQQWQLYHSMRESCATIIRLFHWQIGIEPEMWLARLINPWPW